MKNRLYCGKYKITGKRHDVLAVEIIDDDFAVVKTLKFGLEGAFKDGDFAASFIRRTALTIAEKFHPGARKIIKNVAALNNPMLEHQRASLRDPFHYFTFAVDIINHLAGVMPIPEEERNAYNLYSSVKENLNAFSKDIWAIDEKVALRLGFTKDYVQEEKARVLAKRREAQLVAKEKRDAEGSDNN